MKYLIIMLLFCACSKEVAAPIDDLSNWWESIEPYQRPITYQLYLSECSPCEYMVVNGELIHLKETQ